MCLKRHMNTDTVPSPLEQIEPYLPYEFTCEGMLQRVNAFIENQVPLPPANDFPRSTNADQMCSGPTRVNGGRRCVFAQDFCHGQVMWPPLGAMLVRLAEPGRSCKQVCQEEQLICEPSFFQHLNKDKDLAR